tara:strand:+ start:1517 stop:1711 length:195 start_codon:yes stop_codon:yes gene_type:complete
MAYLDKILEECIQEELSKYYKEEDVQILLNEINNHSRQDMDDREIQRLVETISSIEPKKQNAED